MRTKDEAKAYLEGLAKKAGLDENGIKALLANDEVLEDARNSLTRHDEMASGIDRARNESKAKLDEMTKWYNEIAQPSVAEANKLRAAYNKYKDQYGDLDDGGGTPPRNSNGQFVSRADLDAMGTSGVQVAKQLAFITSDYNSRYGSKYGYMTPEQLDEFEKFAVSRGKPPLESYKEWVAPKEKEAREAAEAQRTADTDARIKAAREEGYREGQTRREWGNNSTKTNTDSFGRDLKTLKLAKDDPDAADKVGEQEFMKAWEEYDQAHSADVR